MRTDVFVVGGGPAGLAFAIAARAKGLRVTVADGMEPPVDKACGECLLPESVIALRCLGIDPLAIESAPIRGIRFLGDGVSVTSAFPSGPGSGVRRTALHAALIAEATRCGVELRWRHPVADLGTIDSRWIVGADGTGSRVRAWANLEASSRNSRRFGFRRHYRIEPPSDRVEIHWTDAAQINITPVAADETGVAVLSRDRCPASGARSPRPADCGG